MTLTALRMVGLALPLAVTGCFSPLLEVGSAGTFAIAPHQPRVHGGGFRNVVAIGETPKEGWGPAVRLEGLTGYDAVRGAQASMRLFGGIAYTGSPPGHLSGEAGLDIGARLERGIGEHDREAGIRGALVYSLGEPRTLYERNKAFVMLGSGVDVVPTVRVGYVWNREAQTLIEVTPGITMRIRIWTDIF